jgi:hypothetical protein
MDLSKLTDEQLDVAEKVAKKAKEKGLNPDFVLPMVMAESGFNPKAESKKGAMGVMQVTQDTADFYKCKDPKDLDQNIDCGLTVLSDLVSKKNIGNDPYKVLSGYNAGPNTKYFTSGKIEDLPDETINHMDRVSTFYGGSLPNVATGEKAAEPENTENSEKVDPGEDKDDGKKVPPGSNAAGSPENVVMGGIGLATGAKIASSIETGKQALPLLQTLYNKATGSDAYMHRPQSRASLQRYLNSQIAEDLRIPLKELEKVAGNGKPVRTMSEVQDALAYIKEVPEQKITKPVYKPQAYGSKTLVDTGKVTPSTIPGRPAVDLSAYQHTPTVLTRAADQAAHAGEIIKGALPSVGRVGFGALGGALAGSQLYDAFEQYKKEGEGLHMPSARNAAQFASGAGGALSMLPFGVTQGVGLALQAPELAYQGYDAIKDMNNRRKSATKEDTDRMLMGVDLMGNPIP